MIVWKHEATMRKLKPTYNPYDKVFTSSKEKQCGKTYGQSNYMEKDLMEHPCCEESWTCTLPAGHDGNHSDLSHYGIGCPNIINPDYEHKSSFNWFNAENPYDEFFMDGK